MEKNPIHTHAHGFNKMFYWQHLEKVVLSVHMFQLYWSFLSSSVRTQISEFVCFDDSLFVHCEWCWPVDKKPFIRVCVAFFWCTAIADIESRKKTEEMVHQSNQQLRVNRLSMFVAPIHNWSHGIRFEFYRLRSNFVWFFSSL